MTRGGALCGFCDNFVVPQTMADKEMLGERVVLLERTDTEVSFGFALSSQKNGEKIVVTVSSSACVCPSYTMAYPTLKLSAHSTNVLHPRF